LLKEAKQPVIGHKLEILPVVDSSNNYAMQQIHDGKAVHGFACMALEQTSGKGQHGKKWYSGKSKNLALSVILVPEHISLENQFLLNAFITVCIAGFLDGFRPGFKIKWPNDLYYHDRKAAGILIENIIRGKTWKFAVVGIGINVNETGFLPELNHAVSLQQLTNKEEDLFTTAQNLLFHINKNWNAFLEDQSAIIKVYNQYLYKKGELVQFRQKNSLFSKTIQQVTEKGVLVCGNGEESRFRHGEIEWVNC
jgi:BirA family biotin operon repressor/biotin-[acetyl-CoA-carboxylase] ligase